jgi:hypothetical protein
LHRLLPANQLPVDEVRDVDQQLIAGECRQCLSIH